MIYTVYTHYAPMIYNVMNWLECMWKPEVKNIVCDDR